MAEAKSRGREKPAKIEQRKVKGRSEDHQSEDLRYNKQHSWLSPICIGQAQGEEKTYKKRSQSACSLALSTACWHAPPLSSLRVFGLACPHASRTDSPAIF